MRTERIGRPWPLVPALLATGALLAASIVEPGAAHAADPVTVTYCVYQGAAPGDCDQTFANIPAALAQVQADEAANGTWAEVAIGPGTWTVLSTLPPSVFTAAGAHTDIHGAGVGATIINGEYNILNTGSFAVLHVSGDTSATTSVHDLSIGVSEVGSLALAEGLDVSHVSVHDVVITLRSNNDAGLDPEFDPMPVGTVGIRAHDDVKVSHAVIHDVFTWHSTDGGPPYVGSWGVARGVLSDGDGVVLDDVLVDWDNQSGGPQLLGPSFSFNDPTTGVAMTGGTLSASRVRVLGLPYGFTQTAGALTVTDSLIEVPSVQYLATGGIASTSLSESAHLSLALDGDTIVRTFPVSGPQGSPIGVNLINTDATITNSVIEVGDYNPFQSPYTGRSIDCNSGSSLTMTYSVYTSLTAYDSYWEPDGCQPNAVTLSNTRTDYTQSVANWPAHDWTPLSPSWLIDEGNPATTAAGRTDALGRARVVGDRIDIGAFECQAACGAPVVQPTKPGKPASAKATKVSGGLKITWGAASSNGATVTSYVVKVGSKTKTVSGSARTATITGLPLGKSATWSVYAVNAKGKGTAASGSAVVIAKPNKPTSLKLTQKAKGKLIVKWKAPAKTKARPRSGYKVYVGGVLKKTTTGTSVTLTGLKKGKTYKIKVVAYNAAGSSAALTKSYHRTIK